MNINNYNFELYTTKGELLLNSLFNSVKNDIHLLRLTRKVAIKKICDSIETVYEIDNSVIQNDVFQNIVNYWNFIFNLAKLEYLSLNELHVEYEKTNQNGTLNHKEIPKNISLLVDIGQQISTIFQTLLLNNHIKISVSDLPPYAEKFENKHDNSHLIFFLWHGDVSRNLYLNCLLNGKKNVQYVNMLPKDINKILNILNDLFPDYKDNHNKKFAQDLFNLSYQINIFNMSVSLINQPSRIDYNIKNLVKNNGDLQILWENELVPHSSNMQNKEFLNILMNNKNIDDYI